jgi:hypothetical protein
MVEDKLVDIFGNEHGQWRIGKLNNGREWRYTLWLWNNRIGKWVLVANQGRKKTCVELASANYRGGVEI